MLSVQKADFSEIDVILALSVQVRDFHNCRFHHYFSDLNVQEEKDFLTKSISDESKVILTAKKNQKTVGFVSASFEIKPYLKRPCICSVYTVCVDQNYRREGIGRALMLKLKQICQEKKVQEIRLGVFVENKEAVAFYHSLGFFCQEQKMQLFL